MKFYWAYLVFVVLILGGVTYLAISFIEKKLFAIFFIICGVILVCLGYYFYYQWFDKVSQNNQEEDKEEIEE